MRLIVFSHFGDSLRQAQVSSTAQRCGCDTWPVVRGSSGAIWWRSGIYSLGVMITPMAQMIYEPVRAVTVLPKGVRRVTQPSHVVKKKHGGLRTSLVLFLCLQPWMYLGDTSSVLCSTSCGALWRPVTRVDFAAASRLVVMRFVQVGELCFQRRLLFLFRVQQGPFYLLKRVRMRINAIAV